MKAVKRIINSVWTLEYLMEGEREIKIINYSRDDDEGYVKEQELPTLVMNETEGRIVDSVKIGDVEYNVVNKKHVFSYEGFTIVESEK